MYVATISRTLSTMDKKKFNNVRNLSKPLFVVKGQPGNLKTGKLGANIYCLSIFFSALIKI